MTRGAKTNRGCAHARWLISVAAAALCAGGAGAQDGDIAGELDLIRERLAAQEQALADAQQRLEDQQDHIQQQNRWIEAQTNLITRQVARIDAMDGDTMDVYTLPVPAVLRAARAAREGERIRNRQPQLLYAQARENRPQNTSGGGGGGGVDASRPNSERQADQLLVDAGGVLLPRNTLQIETGLDYTHISSDRVNVNGFTIFNAIVVGNITVDDISRDILQGTLSTRYGVARRLQLEARIGVQHRNDVELLQVGTNDEEERRIDNFDWGDAEATLAWQPFAQEGWRPAAIVRMRARIPTGRSPFQIEQISVLDPETGEELGRRLSEAPTGSGFWAAGPAVTFVWRADPLVYFAGGGYMANFNRTFGGAEGVNSHINPGDTVEFFSGFNLALSEQVSINTSFQMQHTFETTAEGLGLSGTSTNDARLTFGTSVGITDRVSVVVNAGAGLTDQSPDYTFSVTVPVTFQGLF